MADVVSGGSYYSQSSLVLHFGVGGARKADRLTVRWPGGETQSWTNVGVNRTLRITLLSCVGAAMLFGCWYSPIPDVVYRHLIPSVEHLSHP